MASPMSRDQVLDELGILATVEHALIVEYLSINSALGQDLPDDQGGATTDQGREAAGAAFSLAFREMIQFRDVNLALVEAERPAETGRAFSIKSGSAPEISLEPPSKAQLEGLVEREKAIAKAVDDRYKQLAPAVTSAPVFEDGLLDRMKRLIVEDGPTHEAALGPLNSLGNPVPPDILIVTRRDTDDPFEQRLLDASDAIYRVVVATLRDRFAPPAFGSQTPVTAMEALNDIDRALVQRGLLPPFTAP